MAELRLDVVQASPGAGESPAPGSARRSVPEAAPPAASWSAAAAPPLPSQAQRRRGHRDHPSKLRGVRLLWDENIFGVVGAFCVAAFALAVTWFALEGVLQLNGAFAGLVAIATAAVTLEGISRRHYDEPRRSTPLDGVPADRTGIARAETAPTGGADELAARRRAA